MTTRDSEARKEYEKAWRAKNKERIASVHAAWREANSETIKAKKKAYYEANKERISEKRRTDRCANPAKYNNDVTRAKKTAERRLRHSKFDSATYSAALEKQGHACAICGVDLRTRPRHRVHADHNHETGEPRGVLCGNCNQAIGLMKDSPERLIAAAMYLKNPPLVSA